MLKTVSLLRNGKTINLSHLAKTLVEAVNEFVNGGSQVFKNSGNKIIGKWLIQESILIPN